MSPSALPALARWSGSRRGGSGRDSARACGSGTGGVAGPWALRDVWPLCQAFLRVRVPFIRICTARVSRRSGRGGPARMRSSTHLPGLPNSWICTAVDSPERGCKSSRATRSGIAPQVGHTRSSSGPSPPAPIDSGPIQTSRSPAEHGRVSRNCGPGTALSARAAPSPLSRPVQGDGAATAGGRFAKWSWTPGPPASNLKWRISCDRHRSARLTAGS
jgi:hypothetical protein